MTLLVRNAEVAGRAADVAIVEGRVASMSEPGSAPAPRGAADVDARGGALLPGLHDHHVHLLALAAFRQSVQVGPPAVRTSDAFRQALRAAPGDGWLRGVGYHDSVAGPLDRDALDLLVAGRPVRIQHRSGAMWMLNSAALEQLGVDGLALPGVERDASGRATGRLYGLDEWLRTAVASRPPDLGAVGAELLRYGLTGVTDATATERAGDADLLAAAVADRRLPQHVQLTGGLGLDPAAGAGLPRGPVKLLVADHDLPPLDQLASDIAASHALGRPVAIHAVTRVALLLALAAWREAGVAAGDRLEHGAVVSTELAAQLASLGITVVTQPVLVADRGDEYLAEVDREDLADLWPYQSLLDAGVAMAASSDAPFGDPDPWRGIAAAANRVTAGGQSIGAREKVDPLTALNGYLTPLARPSGPARRVEAGAPADLVLLHVPLRDALAEPSSALVALTIRGGEIQYLAEQGDRAPRSARK